MGKALRRLNPKIKNRVRVRISELAPAEIWFVVRQLGEPYIAAPTGRPGWPAKPMAAIAVWRETCGLTYDGTEAELRVRPDILGLLGLASAPSKSAIHRAAKRLTERWIAAVNRALVARYAAARLAVDSSGWALRDSSAWYDIRLGRDNSQRRWHKAHIAQDIDTGLIHSWTITDGPCGDSPQFRRLLAPFRQLETVAADSAYLSFANVALVARKGATPYIRPKANSVATARHPRPWKRMIRAFRDQTDAWLSGYHIRSVIEGLFRSLKGRFGDALRAVRPRMQRKELALKLTAYNVVQVLYIQAAEWFGLPLWVWPNSG